MIFAAGTSEAALAFIEIGALILGLAILSRMAGRLGVTAVPLYLIAGLALGEGGVAELDVSEDFISLAAEIGVLLLLFTLGLEYSDVELRDGLRTGVRPGLVDMMLNASPGVLLGLVLGWSPLASVLLGGVTWISSSGVVSKVLADLGRLGLGGNVLAERAVDRLGLVEDDRVGVVDGGVQQRPGVAGTGGVSGTAGVAGTGATGGAAVVPQPIHPTQPHNILSTSERTILALAAHPRSAKQVKGVGSLR